MSSVLTLNYNGTVADSLYVILRKKEDYTVADVVTEAWDVWADADIDDYDSAMTFEGGDLWALNFPTWISPGIYIASYYLQAGASPATTDLQLRVRQVTWNGESLAAGGGVTLGIYAWSTLERQKRFMRFSATTHDDLLKDLINSVTEEGENIIQRQIKTRNHTEIFYEVSETQFIQLHNYPITSITSITDDDGSVISSDNYDIDLNTGTLTLTSIGNITSLTISYVGSFPTIPYDLQLWCNEVVKIKFDTTITSLTYSGDSLGDTQYTASDDVGHLDHLYLKLKNGSYCDRLVL